MSWEKVKCLYFCYHSDELCVHDVLHQRCRLQQRPASVSQSKPDAQTQTYMKMQNMNQSAAEIQVNPHKHWIHLDYMSCWFSKHLDDVIFHHSFEIACHLFNYYFLLLTQLSLLILASRFFLFCLFSSSCCCWQNLNNRQFKYNRFYEADRLQLFTESTEINSVIRTHMLKKIRLTTFWWIYCRVTTGSQ